jgi:hypothetical protein
VLFLLLLLFCDKPGVLRSLKYSAVRRVQCTITPYMVLCNSVQVADMKNSVADRSNAQASCAGQFIGNHIEVP